MNFGIRTWDSAGNLVWDSTTAGSGIVADVRSVDADDPATFTYPDFAGFTFSVIVITGFGDVGITVDTALGYPRVNVPAYFAPRKLLMVAR